jgi:ricin-type beta-trefoil lectin protein
MGCLGLLLPIACGTTPLDSVVAERVNGAGRGGEANAGGGGTDAAGTGGSVAGGGTDAGGSAGSDCQVATAPGRYVLRDRENRCVQKGADGFVFTAPIFFALLDANCDSLDAQWDLLQVGPGIFALLNVGVNNNLDVQAGDPTDGTPIVLYMPHPGTNQSFVLQRRTAPYYALEPQNAMQKCVETVGTAAQVFPCDTANEAQDFTLTRVDCL